LCSAGRGSLDFVDNDTIPVTQESDRIGERDEVPVFADSLRKRRLP
jgi:hypothetical protein